MRILRIITCKEIDEILRKHKLWLNGKISGERADFSYADLSNADLRGANFYGADLSNADLSNVDFYGANLSGTDLRGANLSDTDLSGSFGLMSSIDFMNYNFEKTNEGYIAYKTFGFYYSTNKNWKIEVGSVIEEEVNCNRTDTCGCGINVAPLDWVRKEFNCGFPIYRVLIRNEWLMGVCVPYNTDGKIRCAKAEIIGIVEEGTK